jgi:hypothetical protein
MVVLVVNWMKTSSFSFMNNTVLVFKGFYVVTSRKLVLIFRAWILHAGSAILDIFLVCFGTFYDFKKLFKDFNWGFIDFTIVTVNMTTSSFIYVLFLMFITRVKLSDCENVYRGLTSSQTPKHSRGLLV